jgi:AcrR family transcriptional regulator
MADSPSPSPRDRLIAATEAMLRESGMAGTGIKDVVARSGAPIGSLYHYFPNGKTQLVTESLERHAAKFPALVERFFDEKRPPAAAVRALFDNAADVFEEIGADKGCAVGAVSLDLGANDTVLQSACHAAFRDWAGLIEPRLPFSDRETRRSCSVMIIVALEGAFVLSRAAKSGDPFRDAGRWLSRMLAASSDTPPRRARKSKPRTKR